MKNDFASKIMDGIMFDENFRVRDGMILHKESIFLVPESKMKERLISAMHDTPLMGHPWFYKTYRLLRERFTWKGIKDDVIRHVRECSICQENKFKNTLPIGLLQLLSISN